METEVLEWIAAAQVYATLSAGYRTAMGAHDIPRPGEASDQNTLRVLEVAARLNEEKALACMAAAGKLS